MDGRIVKGLPRRARAASGPSNSGALAGPSTLAGMLMGDVNMKEDLEEGMLWCARC